MTKIESKESKEVGMNYAYTIFRPGGNDTALVEGIQREQDVRTRINDSIMSLHPNVEQVGFVSRKGEEPELMMAGGEFCGNATRSTAFLLLDGKPGELLMKVSGVDTKLRAGVSKNGEAWAQMPIYDDPKRISTLSDGSSLVEMKGITHVVMENKFLGDVDQEKLKQYARGYLQELGLTESSPAAGLILTKKVDGVIRMDPVVWVKSISSLFYETACGSGTTAIGLTEALKSGSDVNIPVLQPSGMKINVGVSYDGERFTDAIISGQIKKLASLRLNK